jgi:hypothetical protein
MKRFLVLVACAALIGGWSGTAHAQTESGGSCPAPTSASGTSGDVALLLESSQEVIDGLNAIRPAIADQTAFESGWTTTGPVGEVVVVLLDDATTLENAAKAVGGSAEELEGVRFPIEAFLAELDEARTQQEALALEASAPVSTPCGIVSTIEEVAGFVIEENAGLAQTGAESALLVVVALTLIGGGLTLTMAVQRRHSL